MTKARQIIKKSSDKQPSFLASWGSWVKKVSIATVSSGYGWSVWVRLWFIHQKRYMSGVSYLKIFLFDCRDIAMPDISGGFLSQLE
jgi:hypothetical protein